MPKSATVLQFREPSSQQDGFEMVDVDFSKDTLKQIESWLNEKLDEYISSHANLHQSKIPKWRKLYLGQPESATKSFPFPGASNIVVQIIGDRTDTLIAWVLGFMFATAPLWHYAYPSAVDSASEANRKRELLEEFMDIVGYEPSELDLYRIYGQWFTDVPKLGTSFVQVNIKDVVEATVVGHPV
jgi:hypothetical protein